MVDLVLERVHTGLAQLATVGVCVVPFLTFLADLAVIGEVYFNISCSVKSASVSPQKVVCSLYS